MYWVRFETPHNEFNCFDDEHWKADILLIKAWKKHSDETGADYGYIFEFWDDREVFEISNGMIFKDGELFAQFEVKAE